MKRGQGVDGSVVGSLPLLMNSLGFVVTCLAGWVNRHQQHVIQYLQEEVQVLKELHRGKRLRFNDEQRCRLVLKARKL